MVGLVEERRHVNSHDSQSGSVHTVGSVNQSDAAYISKLRSNGRWCETAVRVCCFRITGHWCLRLRDRTGWTSIEKAEKNEPNECEWRHWSWRSSRISMLGLDPGYTFCLAWCTGHQLIALHAGQQRANHQHGRWFFSPSLHSPAPIPGSSPSRRREVTACRRRAAPTMTLSCRLLTGGFEVSWVSSRVPGEGRHCAPHCSVVVLSTFFFCL